jgi:hypothetical protein
VLAGVFGVEMFFDWLFGFAWPVRLIFFLAAWGGAGWFVWRDFIPVIRKRPSDDEVALMIEREMPVFQTRFISSIQLARMMSQSQARGLCRALIAETAAEAQRLKFHWVVKTKRLRRAIRDALLVFLVFGVLWHLAGAIALPLLARAFLFNVPLPPKTQIVSVTGAASVGVGDDFTIEARIAGIIPGSGRVIVTRPDGSNQIHTMLRDPDDRTHFTLLLESVQNRFDYRVEINDAKAGPFAVETLVQPTIREVATVQHFPEYANQPPKRRSTGDLTLLAGSKLEVQVFSSENLKSAMIETKPDGAAIAMAVDETDPLRATGTIAVPAKGLDGFSLKLTDRNGMTSTGAAVYRITIVPDRVPSVKITYPFRHEELATASARALLAFEATDDLGIAGLKLHYTTDSAKPEAEKTIALDLGSQSERTVVRRFEWDIGKIQPGLIEGNTLEFWVEALDANTVTGPGSGLSDRYQMRVVSPAEKRIDLANRLNDTISGVSDLRDTQQELHKSLGQAIFQKTDETPVNP